MLYVGAYSSFNGVKESKEPVHVRALEKLGHSRGRAERFLKEWRRQEQMRVTDTIDPEDGRCVVVTDIYRSLVFVLPESFRLRNDIVQEFCKSYKCEWTEAKFHVYRLTAVDVMGKSDDWREYLVKQDEVPTTPHAAPVSETATLDQNVPVIQEVEPLA